MKNLIYILFLGIFISSCSNSSSGGSSPCIDGFDQTTLLNDIKNTLIIPSLEDHQSKLTELSNAVITLTQSPTEDNLTEAKSVFKEAYIAFQSVAQYDFGPAEKLDYRTALNNFPIDKAAIDGNISSGLYNFNIEGTFDKGYPALDYILYRKDALSLIQNDTNTQKYLTDVIVDMTTRSQTVLDEWNGEFGSQFPNNTGTAAGTSLSQLINNWNKNYEITKRDRIGIPAGVLTVGQTNPMNVEAYYSTLSLELTKASIQATKSLYDKLSQLVLFVNPQKGATPLHAVVTEQYSTIENNLSKINGTLSQAVDSDKEDINALYNSATQMVLYTKTDLPTALCISITYTENPSDSD